MKHQDLHLLAGLWLIADAAASIAYSTDLILVFQVGRVARLAIGLSLILGKIPGRFFKGIGIYLALEALGSVLVSPDDSFLWQAGRIGRVFIGAWMVRDTHGGT
ncbi:MAG TPA: hypothetical protein VI874_02575 [Candidatus Norongarragalinales archaeon]|nr:hypothetical protein [Candidatus Norongarragalinales archaeon]